MNLYVSPISILLLPFCVLSADECAAARFSFLGPTPYFSAADSPFPVNGSSPDFYLEDFEDGELNTRGIFQPLLPITHASVIRPHELTDSVDSDDGILDGVGNGGHSLAANAFIVFPIDPPQSRSYIRFGFDRLSLGFYPNAFGFVWTDGISSNDILIELFDEQWQLLAENRFERLGDDLLTGQTAEDRFLGVVSTTYFAYVRITSMYAGSPYTFEIDHVQYGLVNVPEPVSILPILESVILLSPQKFVRRRPLLYGCRRFGLSHRIGGSDHGTIQSKTTWKKALFRTVRVPHNAIHCATADCLRGC
jgi:hypothetical protein